MHNGQNVQENVCSIGVRFIKRLKYTVRTIDATMLLFNGSASQWCGFYSHIQEAEPKYSSNEEFPLCTYVEVFYDG
jgi:hypothetical protein